MMVSIPSQSYKRPANPLSSPPLPEDDERSPLFRSAPLEEGRPDNTKAPPARTRQRRMIAVIRAARRDDFFSPCGFSLYFIQYFKESECHSCVPEDPSMQELPRIMRKIFVFGDDSSYYKHFYMIGQIALHSPAHCQILIAVQPVHSV